MKCSIIQLLSASLLICLISFAATLKTSKRVHSKSKLTKGTLEFDGRTYEIEFPSETKAVSKNRGGFEIKIKEEEITNKETNLSKDAYSVKRYLVEIKKDMLPNLFGFPLVTNYFIPYFREVTASKQLNKEDNEELNFKLFRKNVYKTLKNTLELGDEQKKTADIKIKTVPIEIKTEVIKLLEEAKKNDIKSYLQNDLIYSIDELKKEKDLKEFKKGFNFIYIKLSDEIKKYFRYKYDILGQDIEKKKELKDVVKVFKSLMNEKKLFDETEESKSYITNSILLLKKIAENELKYVPS